MTEYYLKTGKKELKSRNMSVPYSLTWLEGGLMGDYLHDLAIVQDFAQQNRMAILEVLCKCMK